MCGGLGAAYLFPPLSSGGASIASPCSVSTSRSSNRTCGFPASGSPTAVAFRHTLPTLSRRLHLKAKLVPGSPGLSSEVLATLQTFVPFPNVGGLPRNSGGSAPALPFSRPAYHEVTGRPAQRSLTLRPAYSPSRPATLYTGGFGDFVAYVAAPITTDLPAELPACLPPASPASAGRDRQAQAGWSNTCRVGLSPTEVPRLSTAH